MPGFFGASGRGRDRLALTLPVYDFIGGPIQNTSGRTLRAPIMTTGQTVHFGVVGSQSLLSSTCTGSTGTSGNLYVPTQALNENVNVFDGGIYATKNPMLGCSAGISNTGEAGVGESILSIFGDVLITAGRCTRSIIMPLGVNATSIQNWLRSTNGDQKDRIKIAFERAAMITAAGGPPVTYFWWSQGTTDAMGGVSQSQYATWLAELIAEIRLYFSGPIFVNQESWTGTANVAGIRAAQAGVVNDTLKIHSGVDLDAYTVGAGYRQADNIHFNHAGAETGSGSPPGPPADVPGRAGVQSTVC